ncbi:MAG TPA: FemAB family XrtA/PEP-CTERM system-associated protein [Sphingomonas sp.]|jgi:FemAB-related protein (PEP-CTERM system-associated)|nr:FemAB family XrtA/PEP-CTERM system-associated protein [Sphingomonas sp.]
MIATRVADLRDGRECGRIDDYVARHADATPFHRPAWSQGIERGCGQVARYLVAERAGTITGVLPLTHMRSALFGNALVSAGFAVDGGLLVDDAQAAQALADAAWDVARRSGCRSVELRGGMVPEGWDAQDGAYLGFRRPLAADDEAEMLAVPRKQRAELRKGLARPLDVSFARDAAALATHFRIYGESVRNLGSPVFPARLFREMLAAFGDDVDIAIVRHEGEAISSVFNLYFRGTVYPYWGGGTKAARALRANDRMYLALMSHARARGCTTFDFGRSKVGSGPALYKKTWGFEPVPLLYARRTAEGAEGRSINPNEPRYQTRVEMWKKLPLWVANRLGPPIARGLG